jgi:hypothetical protein
MLWIVSPAYSSYFATEAQWPSTVLDAPVYHRGRMRGVRLRQGGELEYTVGEEPGQKLEITKARRASILAEPWCMILLHKTGVEV